MEIKLIVCGVDLKSNEARLSLVKILDGASHHIACDTKKIVLGDDRESDSVKAFLHAIKNFAHENGVEFFAIKSRAKSGQMAGGPVSFKMEALFQLTDCQIHFVNPVVLSKFSKTNAAGIPKGILKYQEDAYRCAAYFLDKKKA